MKTAVEWLCNEWLYIDQEFDMCLIDKKVYWEKLRKVQEQAKSMEKQQIIDARMDGINAALKGYAISNEEYYNETYGKDE